MPCRLLIAQKQLGVIPGIRRRENQAIAPFVVREHTGYAPSGEEAQFLIKTDQFFRALRFFPFVLRAEPLHIDRLAPSTLATKRGIAEQFRSEEHTSELQSHSDLVCRLLLEKKKNVN